LRRGFLKNIVKAMLLNPVVDLFNDLTFKLIIDLAEINGVLIDGCCFHVE
jgi:hypothetical protein